jgi:hypothetical protein
MPTFDIKRTIFLTPNSRSEGVKTLEPLPNRVTLRKGEQFIGQLTRSNQTNVNSTIVFDYAGYHFEKPYGGTDVYAAMNARDLVIYTPEGALQGTPQNSNVTPTTRPMEGAGLPTSNGGNSNVPPMYNDFPMPNKPTNGSTTKSTSGTSIFQFKDKLHAGVTLVGVALGVYYAYKTKASIGKYIGYSLGAGAVGFILGSVASSFAMQTPVKEKKMENNQIEGAKTSFTGTISPNIGRKGGKLDSSVESGTMTSQMNSIL